jgi:hypothetical protein
VMLAAAHHGGQPPAGLHASAWEPCSSAELGGGLYVTTAAAPCVVTCRLAVGPWACSIDGRCCAWHPVGAFCLVCSFEHGPSRVRFAALVASFDHGGNFARRDGCGCRRMPRHSV